ncbi:hypothetical protein GCM10009764_68080 [Nocardia ninae]|uniref:Uncharacterized protein n=1 Tax=Nocardia ninae NBRC 108245 TaxID=1210091 RepID=A0A511MCE2_9NOCA|nr:hypothetical protein NN4_23560 [Nocardia ninae NBRC 108245]
MIGSAKEADAPTAPAAAAFARNCLRLSPLNGPAAHISSADLSARAVEQNFAIRADPTRRAATPQRKIV